MVVVISKPPCDHEPGRASLVVYRFISPNLVRVLKMDVVDNQVFSASPRIVVEGKLMGDSDA
jgi:hypothetical protein